MSIHFTEEHLRHAVRILITSPQIIEVRLADAYRQHLACIAPETLPDDLASLYLSIRDRLTRETSLDEEGALMASIGKMRVDEAMQIAGEIYELQRRFSAWLRDQHTLQLAGTS